MKFKNISLVLFATLLYSCSQGQNKKAEKEGSDSVLLSGKIENPTQGSIILEEVKQNQLVPIDTIALGKDNTFSAYVDVKEPGFYRLNLYNQQYVNLVLDDENVMINADITKGPGTATIKGSKDTDYLKKIDEIVRENQRKVMALEQEYIQARKDQNQVRMKELEQAYLELEAKKKEDIKKAIRQMEPSIAAVYGVNYLNQEEDFVFLDSLATKLNKEISNSKYVKDFTQAVNSMRATVVGQQAPEISLPNPQGEVKKLSDLRGKYVLIDFWAAWCGPCRRENPNVVKVYNKYHDKGFEVFGVSLDRNREDWVKAIEKDGLVWTQVSDLKYFDSEAARKYSIQSIPATVLVDPQGKIIAKNLRGEELENKLEEIFSKRN